MKILLINSKKQKKYFLEFLKLYIFEEVFSSGTLFPIFFWDQLFFSKVLNHCIYASKDHQLRNDYTTFFY